MEVSRILHCNCSPMVFVRFQHTVPLITVTENKFQVNDSAEILTALSNLVHQMVSASKEGLMQPHLAVHFRLNNNCSGLWSTHRTGAQEQDLHADSDLQAWCQEQLAVINHEMERFQLHNRDLALSLNPTECNLSLTFNKERPPQEDFSPSQSQGSN